MNERAIFTEALDRETPADRAAYLDTACAGDPALRARVEALLWSHEQAGEFPGKLAPQRLAEEFAGPPPDDDTRTGPSGPDADDGLDFLEASDQPGSLGRLGHYEVQQVVGRGGMGVVLKAFDENLHRVVAIKVMAPEMAASASARKRFVREARAAAAVTHDHVVTIHGVEEANGLPYIVMQYVDGMSLQERLDRTGPLPLAEVLRIGMQAAAGLAAAHKHGLVHRDIKPANILLENGVERVKLTDFGLARAADDASLTQSGQVAGTPAYMSPEQAEGKPVDHRSDLFSLGSALYVMCAGRPPFRAATNIATLKRVCEDTPTPIRQVNPDAPDWLAAVVEKLHAKDPARRFQSAAELAELLGRHLAQVQHPSVAALPPVTPAAGPAPPVRSARHHRWAVAAGILLALLAGLGTTEATGVTNVRGTVLRVFTPQGTLVVETDDPDVKVTVEGDGGLLITGDGLEEIRLRPGSYRVVADRDGKRVPLDRELVTVSRGGREIVRVKLEAPATPPAAPVEKGAFVLFAAGKERKFDTLAEAVLTSTDGDLIEIRGNGPFLTDPVDLGRQALTIRAAGAFRPVIRLSESASRTRATMVKTKAPLVLEGIDFLIPTGLPKDVPSGHFVVCESGLHVANCRFRAEAAAYDQCLKAKSLVARNCEFLNAANVAVWPAGVPGTPWLIQNCVCAGHHALYLVHYDTMDGIDVHLVDDTLLCPYGAAVYLHVTNPNPLTVAKPNKPIKLDVSGSILDGVGVMHILPAGSIEQLIQPEEAEARTRRALVWQDRENIYSMVGFISWHDAGDKHALKSVAAWKKFWGRADTGAREGQVRFQGGNLPAKLNADLGKLTPADFRLRPDSAGYRGRKDGKDLGADVDLVGPGPAYERWKKTPEYQQWLKETGQARAPSPKAEPNAFAVLGGQGVEVGKFPTLAEAVRRAGHGGTIEVRGNGPFVTDPIELDRQALTIRAAAGFRPVIRLSGQGVHDRKPLVRTRAALVLEGLDFQVVGPAAANAGDRPMATIVEGEGERQTMHLANCRFYLDSWPWPRCVSVTKPHTLVVARNCEFYCPTGGAGHAIVIAESAGSAGRLVMDNCVHLGDNGDTVVYMGDDHGAEIELTRNTLVLTTAPVNLLLGVPPKGATAVSPTRVRAAGNVFDASAGLWVYRAESFDRAHDTPPGPGQLEALVRRLVTWEDRQNLYRAGGCSVFWSAFKELAVPARLKGPEEWKRFWATPDGTCEEGPIRFQGGDLHKRLSTAPDRVTPDDFRLRPDSAGYRAGKAGKNLGADVDLVGPGPAYDRWKETAGYQNWLKETGQRKAASPEAESNAFVVLGGQGVEVGKFDTLADAVWRASSGDTIEIRGNGPFVTDPVNLGTTALTIRAGSGYAPVIKPSPAAVKTDAALVECHRALTLEGLEIHHQGLPDKSDRGIIERGVLSGQGAALYLTNCKLVANPGKQAHAWAICYLSPERVHVRNSLIVAPTYGVGIWNAPRTHCTVDNCLIASSDSVLLSPDEANSPGTNVRLFRNQLIGADLLYVSGPAAALVKRLREKAAPPVVPAVLESEGNVVQCRRVIVLNVNQAGPPDGLGVEEQRRFAPLRIRWQERGNVYDVDDEFFLNLHAPPTRLLKGLTDWNEFWGLKETGTVQGRVLLRGNPKEMLLSHPEAITLDDFRLRSDSAGYRAGKDGKDLGADVDLVGPGAAYERWKKTPEYQEWLKETRQKN